MYLRIETRIDDTKAVTSMKVLAVSQNSNGMANFRLDGSPEVWALDIGNPLSKIPEDALGEMYQVGVSLGAKSNGCPVYSIEMMPNIDDEVRSILMQHFEADEQPQARPEPTMPMMMGFDD